MGSTDVVPNDERTVSQPLLDCMRRLQSFLVLASVDRSQLQGPTHAQQRRRRKERECRGIVDRITPHYSTLGTHLRPVSVYTYYTYLRSPSELACWLADRFTDTPIRDACTSPIHYLCAWVRGKSTYVQGLKKKRVGIYTSQFVWSRITLRNLDT